MGKPTDSAEKEPKLPKEENVLFRLLLLNKPLVYVESLSDLSQRGLHFRGPSSSWVQSLQGSGTALSPSRSHSGFPDPRISCPDDLEPALGVCTAPCSGLPSCRQMAPLEYALVRARGGQLGGERGRLYACLWDPWKCRTEVRRAEKTGRAGDQLSCRAMFWGSKNSKFEPNCLGYNKGISYLSICWTFFLFSFHVFNSFKSASFL